MKNNIWTENSDLRQVLEEFKCRRIVAFLHFVNNIQDLLELRYYIYFKNILKSVNYLYMALKYFLKFILFNCFFSGFALSEVNCKYFLYFM